MLAAESPSKAHGSEANAVANADDQYDQRVAGYMPSLEAEITNALNEVIDARIPTDILAQAVDQSDHFDQKCHRTARCGLR